jgi:prevent-host-death family protein
MTGTKIADLKNNLSRHLARVRRGGEVVVLDRDTPIARIVPFAPREAGDARAGGRDDYWTPERLTDLERLGVIRRGDARGITAWLRTGQPVKLPAGSPSALDVLLRMRRESTR